MLLAIENRPLEKIRKGDPHWKPSILLSMLVFRVYKHFGMNHDIALRCYCNFTPSHWSLTFLVLWQSWRILQYSYVIGQECLSTALGPPKQQRRKSIGVVDSSWKPMENIALVLKHTHASCILPFLSLQIDHCRAHMERAGPLATVWHFSAADRWQIDANSCRSCK